MLVVCLYFCPLQKIWKVQKWVKQLPKVHPSSSVISPDPSLCLSFLLQKHSFTEFLLWAWACHCPCPCPCPWQCPVLWDRDRTRGGKTTENGLLLWTVNFSQRTSSKEQAFVKNLEQKIGMIALMVIVEKRKWVIKMQNTEDKVGNEDAKHTEQW